MDANRYAFLNSTTHLGTKTFCFLGCVSCKLECVQGHSLARTPSIMVDIRKMKTIGANMTWVKMACNSSDRDSQDLDVHLRTEL